MNNLKLYREENKITQKELAELADVSIRHIAFIEAGERTPSLNLAKTLSRILKKSIEEIFL